MNILAVNNLNFLMPKANETQQKGVSYPHFGLTMPKQLSCDTVSFKAKKVKLPKEVIRGAVDTSKKGKGILYGESCKIHRKAKILQKDITSFFQKNFRDLVATKEHPDRPILVIKGRAKTPGSIQQKSEELQLYSIDEVFSNLTDLNGVKIVLRDASPKAVKKVLKAFTNTVENGSLIIGEVEAKRPIAAEGLNGKKAAQWDYGAPETLSNFVDKITELGGREVVLKPPAYTKANYTALHLLARFPGSERFFEIQIMGKDVAAFKEFDDVLYKILDNKSVDPKFEPVVQRVEELKQPENKKILDNFNKQRRATFLFQREKEPTLYERSTETFLPLKYDIPERYDINELYKIYQDCKNEVDSVVETILGSTDENVIKKTKRRRY